MQVTFIKEDWYIMKIVLYRPGNFMKGVLRFLFKVKKSENT